MDRDPEFVLAAYRSETAVITQEQITAAWAEYDSLGPPRVISAFPATGKTTLAKMDKTFTDSDSSHFSWESPGVRHPDWPANYMEHIRAALAEGRRVLCSSHEEVRSALVAAGIPFTLAYPTLGQREAYIERMERRGSPESLIAFVTANWDDLIESCEAQSGCAHLVLTRGTYLNEALR